MEARITARTDELIAAGESPGEAIALAVTEAHASRDAYTYGQVTA